MPEEPLEPLVPLEPLEPLVPLEPLEPLVPLEPLEPLEPEVPFSTNPIKTFSSFENGLLPLEEITPPNKVTIPEDGPLTLVNKNVIKFSVFDFDLIVKKPGALGVGIVLLKASVTSNTNCVLLFCVELLPLIVAVSGVPVVAVENSTS